MDEIITFFTKYWVETICVGITSIISIFWVKAKNIYKTAMDVKKEKEAKPIKDWADQRVEEESAEIVAKFEEEKAKVWDAFDQARADVFSEVAEEKRTAAEERAMMMEYLKKIYADQQNQNAALQECQKSGEATRQAVLYWYKKEFLEDCGVLLDKEHKITFDEYQQVQHSHDVYKSLGGNHEGDHYFRLIEEKYSDSTK